MQKMKMKEITTLFKLFGIRYFIDEDGQYYKKVGGNSRKPVKPFWKKRRFKLGLPLLILVVLGIIGYQIGMNLASEKIVKEISSQIPEKDIQALLKDPTIQQIIEDEVGQDKKQQILNKYSVDTLVDSSQVAVTNKGSGSVVNSDGQNTNDKSTNSQDGKQTPTKNKLKFNSKDEVTKFLLSKFSMGELMGFADKVKGGATPEVKSEIQATVMQRLTDEEYEALKVFAVIELSKS